jgi:predicted AAA+ superfamily ATPase
VPARRAGPLFPRFVAERVRRALRDTPAVLIQGARQVGKSTLAGAVLGRRRSARLVTLDDPATLAAARADPTGFVIHEGVLAIDEIQGAPELLLPIKACIDRDRRPGRFLLTGSAHVLVLPRVADTLAGRMEVVELWPLSRGEILKRRERFVDRLLEGGAFVELGAGVPRSATLTRHEILGLAVAGGFPEARQRASARRAAWFEAYLQAFVQRDVRDIADLEHVRRLRGLLALVAARTGNLLNIDDLARDHQLPASTVRRYLDVLEAAYLLVKLPAWSTNRTQRVVSAPKAYLSDSGLCAHLLGCDVSALAAPTADAGPLLETFVLLELKKQLGWSSARATLHHLRTKDQLEVDIVLQHADGRIAGVEVKAAASLGARDFAGLRWLRERAGGAFRSGVVLYGGEEVLPFGPGLWALPWGALWA